MVIDAGHGGHDSGAIGPGGTMEKDVSLQIATRLGELLSDRGLEVILTRDDDRFVKLEDRARLANEAKGDLFISVHCNSAPKKKARGIETYSLNIASDRYSIRLAARENSSSEKGMSDLQFILADLATKANTEESTRLGEPRPAVARVRARGEVLVDPGSRDQAGALPRAPRREDARDPGRELVHLEPRGREAARVEGVPAEGRAGDRGRRARVPRQPAAGREGRLSPAERGERPRCDLVARILDGSASRTSGAIRAPSAGREAQRARWWA